MIISVASGKGGTGKTLIATNLCLSLDGNTQFLDCDVEEPDAHIFLKPQIKKSQPVTIPIPKVDEAKCTRCGKCAEVCAYNAIAVIKDKVLIFPELCHGCGGCSLLCPEKAISEVDKVIGVIEVGEVGPIQFVHGKLNISEPMAPPVIRAVKGYINPTRDVIIDVSPGTSCPVIEAIKGSDYCILVTEPTPFGLSDLRLAVEVLKKLEIPFGIVINRADLGDEKVDGFCHDEDIPILMRIPFDREIAMAYSKGIAFCYEKKEWVEKFKDLYLRIEQQVSSP